MSCNSELIGVGGTIAGVIIGFFLTRLDRAGKIKILQKGISFFIIKNRVTEGEHLLRLGRVIIDFYNSSRDTKVIRDLFIFTIDRHKRPIFFRIENNETPVQIITILTKEHIRISGDIYETESSPIPVFDLRMKFYIQYHNQKNKLIRSRIKDVTYRDKQDE